MLFSVVTKVVMLSSLIAFLIILSSLCSFYICKIDSIFKQSLVTIPFPSTSYFYYVSILYVNIYPSLFPQFTNSCSPSISQFIISVVSCGNFWMDVNNSAVSMLTISTERPVITYAKGVFVIKPQSLRGYSLLYTISTASSSFIDFFPSKVK